jgi:hypothetical protein
MRKDFQRVMRKPEFKILIGEGFYLQITSEYSVRIVECVFHWLGF